MSTYMRHFFIVTNGGNMSSESVTAAGKAIDDWMVGEEFKAFTMYEVEYVGTLDQAQQRIPDGAELTVWQTFGAGFVVYVDRLRS